MKFLRYYWEKFSTYKVVIENVFVISSERKKIILLVCLGMGRMLFIVIKNVIIKKK